METSLIPLTFTWTEKAMGVRAEGFPLLSQRMLHKDTPCAFHCLALAFGSVISQSPDLGGLFEDQSG